MIIDGHCHAGQGDGLSAPWNSGIDLTRYLRRCDAAGITRSVVLPAFHSDNAVGNRLLARVVARYRPRLIGFAMVHCRRDRGRMRALVGEAVERYGFRGIKAHQGEAPATRELFATARAFRLPVLLDVFARPQALGLIAREYPDVPLIIPHLGSFADDWAAQQQVCDLLARHPNLYADTSGVRRFDYLVEAVRRAGPGKLIFGSDGPWLHPGLELHKIRLLGLKSEQERQVTGGTMARLLGLRSADAELTDPVRSRRSASPAYARRAS
jgi:predicted TIM-barrel fold metal-dependent hydrolase